MVFVLFFISLKFCACVCTYHRALWVCQTGLDTKLMRSCPREQFCAASKNIGNFTFIAALSLSCIDLVPERLMRHLSSTFPSVYSFRVFSSRLQSHFAMIRDDLSFILNASIRSISVWNWLMELRLFQSFSGRQCCSFFKRTRVSNINRNTIGYRYITDCV